MKSSQVQFLRTKIGQILPATMIMDLRLLGQYQCSLCGVIICYTLGNSYLLLDQASDMSC